MCFLPLIFVLAVIGGPCCILGIMEEKEGKELRKRKELEELDEFLKEEGVL